MTVAEATDQLAMLNDMDPEELLAWAQGHFPGRAGINTSFQDTGCVMIDMASRVAPDLRVLTVDTLRLHPETYRLMEQIEARYGIAIERFKPEPEQLKRMVGQHGEYLFFDSKAKQEYCCAIRKVEPNKRAIESLDVWITGLRRDQSEGRAAVDKVSRIVLEDGRELLKLSPLANWDKDQVWSYIHRHNVPYSPLYEQGYTSIGCVICSTPTMPWESKRAGRWRWFNHLDEDDDKECGIHIGGSGI
jgi:phosphoadenosine phosphosulfate reductase